MRPSIFRSAFALALTALTVPAPEAASVNVRGAPTWPAIGASSPEQTAQGTELLAGMQAQQRGELAAAQTRYEAALKIDPRYVPAMLALAGLEMGRGAFKRAESLLQQAEQIEPKSLQVHLVWGRYFSAQRQFDKAEKSLLTAGSLAPKSLAPLVELGDLYLLMAGRRTDALRVYREAAALNGDNSIVQYGLGAAAAANGQRIEAMKAFERAAELAPRDPRPLRAIGRLELEAGANEKALSAFDRGLTRKPDLVPLMVDRADALDRLGRRDDALAQLATAQKAAPDSVDVLLKTGDVQQGTKRWDEAQSSYLKVIALAPQDPVAYNNLAWMTVSGGRDAKKAVAWARQAVALSPNSSPFHDTLGWAERAAGNLPGAASSIGKAIALEPRVAGYHLHLGIVQAELRQFSAARASLNKVLQIEPAGSDAAEARDRLSALPRG